MSVDIHNPDQYMAALRTIIAQGRKRVGLLVGAGAPAGIRVQDGTAPLIPAVEGLTVRVLDALAPEYATPTAALRAELERKDIESLLSRIRTLAQVIGATKVHGLDSTAYAEFGRRICEEIGRIVDVRLPEQASPYSDLVTWISGAARDNAVEIFTTNYDLLFEQAFEAARAPYFDGFTGGREPFFDPVSVANNDLPPRWTRLWKLHGSLGWRMGERNEVVRTGDRSATHLVFPEHLKYEQTQKAPYSALLDRLRSFLQTPDTLLVSIGFSFADAHISARIDEALSANPSASVFAFQFKNLSEESAAVNLASRCPNFSVYARDMAMVNGVPGRWEVPRELPHRDWGPIRSTYWGSAPDGDGPAFLLGAVDAFARFFAASRSNQAFVPVPAPIPPVTDGEVKGP